MRIVFQKYFGAELGYNIVFAHSLESQREQFRKCAGFVLLVVGAWSGLSYAKRG